jgi:hypothetical protein
MIISSVKGTPQYNRAMEEVVNTQEDYSDLMQRTLLSMSKARSSKI